MISARPANHINELKKLYNNIISNCCNIAVGQTSPECKWLIAITSSCGHLDHVD